MVDFKLQTKQNIQNKILKIRGLRVMLDRDLAVFYSIETRVLKQAVKRNKIRFPDDFMFVLTEDEVDLLVSQNVIPSKKHIGGALPYVFTEQGVANLASVLNSNKAIEVNILIIRAFVEMRHFLSQNNGLFARMNVLERNQLTFQLKIDERFEQIFAALKKGDLKQGIFYDGQIFDAYVFVSDLVKKAKTSIVLLDNYIDKSVLTLLSKRKRGVSVIVYTKRISAQLALDIKKYNAQYEPIMIKEFDKCHDRFLIVDDQVYHFGASLKDLGKKWFAFSKIDSKSLMFLDKISQLK